MADIYTKLGAMEDAQKEYIILTKIDAGNFYNFFKIGEIFNQRGMVDTAINYFRKAVNINPKHEESYFELGHVYYQLNRLADAKSSMLKVIKIKH